MNKVVTERVQHLKVNKTIHVIQPSLHQILSSVNISIFSMNGGLDSPFCPLTPKTYLLQLDSHSLV